MTWRPMDFKGKKGPGVPIVTPAHKKRSGTTRARDMARKRHAKPVEVPALNWTRKT